jgi:AraC-like DNA-binding protein
VYLDRSPRGWRRPTPVAVTPLLRELAGHLARPAGDGGPARWRPGAARRRCCSTCSSRSRPRRSTSRCRATRAPSPSPRRCSPRRTTPGASPAWGRAAGAAGRTLARLFEAETGLSFGRWRTNVRLRAAMLLLAEGEPVAVVAHRVGYATPSAFVAAFRRQLGATPGAFYG